MKPPSICIRKKRNEQPFDIPRRRLGLRNYNRGRVILDILTRVSKKTRIAIMHAWNARVMDFFRLFFSNNKKHACFHCVFGCLYAFTLTWKEKSSMPYSCGTVCTCLEIFFFFFGFRDETKKFFLRWLVVTLACYSFFVWIVNSVKSNKNVA